MFDYYIITNNQIVQQKDYFKCACVVTEEKVENLW